MNTTHAGHAHATVTSEGTAPGTGSSNPRRCFPMARTHGGHGLSLDPTPPISSSPVLSRTMTRQPRTLLWGSPAMPPRTTRSGVWISRELSRPRATTYSQKNCCEMTFLTGATTISRQSTCPSARRKLSRTTTGVAPDALRITERSRVSRLYGSGGSNRFEPPDSRTVKFLLQARDWVQRGLYRRHP